CPGAGCPAAGSRFSGVSDNESRICWSLINIDESSFKNRRLTNAPESRVEARVTSESMSE
ncbi:MAG: hypothetical protein KDH84_26475, partial [Calditrichaeota bacterium]|nr:hypothetical protein [Calditrichota bacterium]